VVESRDQTVDRGSNQHWRDPNQRPLSSADWPVSGCSEAAVAAAIRASLKPGGHNPAAFPPAKRLPRSSMAARPPPPCPPRHRGSSPYLPEVESSRVIHQSLQVGGTDVLIGSRTASRH
jgi:hypothetical protein